jgi:DNA polymerase-3 subunit delta
VRILNGLQGEGVASAVVLWALVRDLRQLSAMAQVLAGGQSLSSVLARFRIWQSRTTAFSRALQRLSGATCNRLLRRCALIDRVIKGQAAGNAWDELLQLTLCLAGVDAVPAGLKREPQFE